MIAVWLAMLLAGPVQFESVSKQAAAAREANNSTAAVKLYREAVRLRPAWAEGWWYIGTLLYEDDQYPAARDAFHHFVNAEPSAGPGWAMLGLCEFQAKEYEQALTHLQLGLQRGLGANAQLTHVARYHRAILLTRFSEFEAALQTFVLLSADGINDSKALAASGMAALRMPMLPAELPPAQQQIVLEVGRAVFDTGARRTAEAKRDWEQLVEKYGSQPHIHYMYGGFLLLSDSEAAIKEWQRELEISPKHVPARLQLVYEYLKRGEAGRALPFAEQAAQLEPQSFIVHHALGRALVEGGDLPRGISELELATKTSPQSPENHVALASAYAKAGRREDAARERTTFLRLKKEQEP